MIRNYFLLFFRNFRRQKLFSAINLLGLTVSIASTLLIYLDVKQEFSYDRFHKDAGRIYRVNQTFIWGDGADNQFASTGPGVATALEAELPEIELMTSIHTPGNFLFSYTRPSKEVVSFEEEKVYAADTNFLRMFNFPLVRGEVASALRQAHTMVITESTARKYFGSEEPVGKLIRLGAVGPDAEPTTYEVTGVVQDPPDNSYFDFHVVLSMNSFPQVKRLNWSWLWTQLETYIKVREGTDIENTKAKLVTIPRKYAEETLRRTMNTSYEEYTKSGKKWELFLQPLTSIHLPTELVFNRLNDSGNLKVIYSFIAAAVFIILLSCVNFMNLSMAQFTRRIKEASIRKILGLGRKQLGIGYFIEALTFCFFAMVAALAFAQLLLPGFNYITGKSLRINFVDQPGLALVLFGLVLFMAILSSAYPSVFLSAFHPVEAMKGKLKSGQEGKAFRNGLVVFQFAVSIVLIVCTAVVFQQLSYVSKKDVGFDRENLLVVEHVERMKDPESFEQAALTVTGVIDDSRSTSVPPKLWGGDKFTAEGMNDKTFSLNYVVADERYIPTLGIHMRWGRNFSADIPADANRVIVNEATIKKIGWTFDESVLGKKLLYDGSSFEVAGVVSDFNYWSLATPIEPMAIFHIKGTMKDGPREYVTLRIARQDGDAWKSTLSQLTSLWKARVSDTPFEYAFIDQAFAETFKSQEQFGNVLTVMTALAILIACLGLLGIIIYSLEQRSKEIGIRKISGASVWNILTLIGGSYSKLIVAAFLIGAPLAYYMMHLWLEDFAYKIAPSIWIFAGAGIGTLGIALLIASYHSVKAASMNPVEILRDE